MRLAIRRSMWRQGLSLWVQTCLDAFPHEARIVQTSLDLQVPGRCEAFPCPVPPLLPAQGHHWVYLGGASGRPPCGEEGDAGEHQRGAGEYPRIRAFQAEEQGLGGLA